MNSDKKKITGLLSLGFLLLVLSGTGSAALNKKSGAAILEDEDLTQALANLEREELKPEASVSKVQPQDPEAVKKTERRILKESDGEGISAEKIQAEKDEFGIPRKKSKAVKVHEKTKNVFSFSERLDEAEVQLLNSAREVESSGTWTGSSFTFASLKTTEVKTAAIPLGLQTQKAIAVTVLPKYVYQIRFGSVAPFERLKLQYSVKETYQGKAPAYLSLRVLAGSHELKRIQVSSKDPWVKQTFNLGVVSFLNRNIPILFEFSTAQAKGLTLFLIAETD